MSAEGEWTTETVEIAILCRERELQSRAATDDDTINAYAELLANGVKLPAPAVFRDGDLLRVADGHHTIAAYEERGETRVAVRVRYGTREDAILYAAGANATHGLRRTSKDKRRAVELVLGVHPSWSNGVVAAHCAVSDGLVKGVRIDLGLPEMPTRVDRRGRPMNVGRIGQRVNRPPPADTSDATPSADPRSPSSSVRLTEEVGARDDGPLTDESDAPPAAHSDDVDTPLGAEHVMPGEDRAEPQGPEPDDEGGAANNEVDDDADDGAPTDLASEVVDSISSTASDAALAYEFDRWTDDMMLVREAAELLGLGTEPGSAIEIDVGAAHEHVATRLEEVRQRYCEANVMRAIEAVNRYNEMVTTAAFKKIAARLAREHDISDAGPLRRR